VGGGQVQRFVRGYDLPGEWWKLFHSEDLTALMERALRENHDLKAAQAALRVARANYEAQKGALFPVIGASETSSRQKVATADLAPPTISGDPYYTLHTAQLSISYVPDVFGGIRRQVEAASAQAESQRFALEATYLTLTSNLALAAIQTVSLEEQIRVTGEVIGDLRTLAEGEGAAASFCSASLRDWSALRAAIDQAQQTVPLLRKQLAAQRDLLAALTAQYPGAVLPERFSLKRIHLPRDLPLALPSRLVWQRPDVRAAQANLHAAGALVGVAVANRLPLFNLTGNLGRSSSQFGNLASSAPQFQFWTIAGSVTQTLFDGFTLAQRQRAAEAGLEQAAEQYRSTVSTAFQNVADVLQAVELDGKSEKIALKGTTDARENLCLSVAGFVGYDGQDEPGEAKLKYIAADDPEAARRVGQVFGAWWNRVCQADSKRLRDKLADEATDRKEIRTPGGPDSADPDAEKAEAAGKKNPCPKGDDDSAPSGIDVVTSVQLLLATRLSLVTAHATRYMDVVALFQALGGGWWNRIDDQGRDQRGLAADVGPSPSID